MTFITQTDRIYITSGSGASAVVKYDTYEPHPIVYSRINGTISVSNTVSSYTFSIPTREGSGSETRLQCIWHRQSYYHLHSSGWCNG